VNPAESPAHRHHVATEYFHFYRHDKRGGKKTPNLDMWLELKKEVNRALLVRTKEMMHKEH